MKLNSLLHADLMTASQHLQNMSLLDDMCIGDTETEFYVNAMTVMEMKMWWPLRILMSLGWILSLKILPLWMNCYSISENHNICNVDFTDKAIQRVSEVRVNNVKYAVKDVFVIDVLHSERIPLFWRLKYILNIDTLWILCGKMLVLLSYDCHFHAYSVKVDGEWTLLKPGDEMDFQVLDTYSVDNSLYVTLRHSI